MIRDYGNIVNKVFTGSQPVKTVYSHNSQVYPSIEPEQEEPVYSRFYIEVNPGSTGRCGFGSGGLNIVDNTTYALTGDSAKWLNYVISDNVSSVKTNVKRIRQNCFQCPNLTRVEIEDFVDLMLSQPSVYIESGAFMNTALDTIVLNTNKVVNFAEDALPPTLQHIYVPSDMVSQYYDQYGYDPRIESINT